MKKYAPLVIVLAIIATVAMANRYEQLSVGELTVETSIVAPTVTATGAIAGATVTATGAVTGGTLAMAEGYFDVISTTQLVYIASAGAYTNVIDVDITTP